MIGLILGDSAVISQYPNLDAQDRWQVPTGNHNAHAGENRLTMRLQQYGADFLLWQNDNARFPEFVGRDLLSVKPGARVYRRAQDGGTRFSIAGQLERWMGKPIHGNPDDVDVLCVSIGGNDLLGVLNLGKAIPERHFDLRQTLWAREGVEVAKGIIQVLTSLRPMFPNATMLVNTVYDPTDDTGELEGYGEVPIALLKELNEQIRVGVAYLQKISPATTLLCDVEHHFLGHGITAKGDDRWYWEHSIIEPNVFGASEIRRLWIDALGL